jgi:hypothetical protein
MLPQHRPAPRSATLGASILVTCGLLVELVLFRFTIIWERVIVIMAEERAESIVIIQESGEPGSREDEVAG